MRARLERAVPPMLRSILAKAMLGPLALPGHPERRFAAGAHGHAPTPHREKKSVLLPQDRMEPHAATNSVRESSLLVRQLQYEPLQTDAPRLAPLRNHGADSVTVRSLPPCESKPRAPPTIASADPRPQFRPDHSQLTLTIPGR